jgi:exodeoxyribonuclease III
VLVVSTVNVNGLRAAARKGYVEWLASSAADVVCLQETRAEPGELPDELREPAGWRVVHAPSETMKGRCGVAVLSRLAPTAVRVGFGSTEFDRDGRYVEIDLPGVTVGSLYLVNGTVGTPRQDAKERFMAEFLPYLVERREKAAIDGREVVVCGDWNIAHREADLKSWKGNRRNSGFLPNERAWLDSLFGEAGYVDVVRSLHPDRDGPYSWWSFRGKAFDNDAGWRIDYHAATPGLATTARSAVVERAPAWDARWSDHAPVTVTYDFQADAGRIPGT